MSGSFLLTTLLSFSSSAMDTVVTTCINEYKETYTANSSLGYNCSYPDGDFIFQKLVGLTKELQHCPEFGKFSPDFSNVQIRLDSVLQVCTQKYEAFRTRGEAIKKKMIARDLRSPSSFPASIRLDQDYNDIAERINLCYSEDNEVGTKVCDLRWDSTIDFTIASFTSGEADVYFFSEDSGRFSLPYRTTITSQDYDDCDDMASAKESIIAALAAKYKGSKAKIQKGPKFGSKKCKDYMNEGLTSYTIQTSDWRYVIDSYWNDGAYKVYAAYIYLPRDRIVDNRIIKQRRNNIRKAYNKL